MKVKLNIIVAMSAISLFLIFGFIKPHFSANSTSYLFGAIEKKPNVKI